MDLKGGVLLIGSLFWQDYRDEPSDNIRKKWRDGRLNMSGKQDVRVPIRYGRKSCKNGEIYTMVIDNSIPQEKFGSTKFVPLKKKGYLHINEILDEAKELSKAEGPRKNLVKGIQNGKDPWCICSILINEKKLGKELANKIRVDWKRGVLSTPDTHNVLDVLGSRLFEYSLNENYELKLDWPSGLEDFDFLLCTSTKPDKEVQISGIAHNVFNRPYFFANLAHGINTFQDQDIIDELENTRENNVISNENRLFSYCIPVDDGAAPNPYFDICTLAICKPVIRRVAKVGDWVAGVGSKNVNGMDFSGKLVYAMKVTQIESMESYDELCNAELNNKIPDFKSKDSRRWVGDCIYDYSKGAEEPELRESVHKVGNIDSDKNGKNVLLSNEFYYFGDNPINIPEHLSRIIKQGQGHKSNENNPVKNAFVEFIENLGFEMNKLHGNPQLPFRVGKSLGCDVAEVRSRCAKEDLEIEDLNN